MKQIIEKNYDGKIWRKYYINHLNQLNGLFIYYYNNGNISCKHNYLNNKLIGLNNWYDNKNKIEKIYYNL